MPDNELRRFLLPIANTVFIIVSIICLVGVFTHPYIGIALENRGGNWTVVYSDLHGEGSRLGIREGDIILKIDNTSPGSHPSVQRWGEIEGASVLSVISPEGTFRSVEIPESSYFRTLSNEYPLVVIGLCFWLIGFYSVFKRPSLRQALALFQLNWLVGLLFIIAPASSRGLFLAKEFMFFGFSAAPILLLYFFAVLLKQEQNRFLKITLRLLCILPMLILITIVLKWLGMVHAVSELRTMSLINAMIGSLAALGFLLRALKQPSDQPEKNRIMIMLAGLTISVFPFILLSAVPIILGMQPILYPKFTALFIVFLPLSMSYIVVNQYLPDAGRILKGISVYFITGIVTSLILYTVLYTSGWITQHDVDIFLSLFALTIGCIIVFFGMKALWGKISDKMIVLGDFEGKESLPERNNDRHFDNEEAVLKDLVSFP